MSTLFLIVSNKLFNNKLRLNTKAIKKICIIGYAIKLYRVEFGFDVVSTVPFTWRISVENDPNCANKLLQRTCDTLEKAAVDDIIDYDDTHIHTQVLTFDMLCS